MIGREKQRERDWGGCVLGPTVRESSCVFLLVWLVNWAGVKRKNVVLLKHMRERERERALLLQTKIS